MTNNVTVRFYGKMVLENEAGEIVYSPSENRLKSIKSGLEMVAHIEEVASKNGWTITNQKVNGFFLS